SRSSSSGLETGEERSALLEARPGRETSPPRGVRKARVLGTTRQSKAPPELGGSIRDQRRRQERDDPQRLQAVTEHLCRRGRVARLVERPWLALLDVGVGRPDELP